MTDAGETVIETPRLLLRRLNDDDYARLHEFQQSPEVNRFTGGPPLPLDEFVPWLRARWEDHYRKHGWGQWAVVRKEDGAFVGRCGLIMQQVDGADEVEVGYALGRPYWGRGYAAEAAVASRDWAFRNLDVPHVISLIHPDNARSIAVARRNGMTLWKTTTFKEMPGIGVWRITREEWERAAAPA
ncbi:MAG TPA: GNAT family N-acetyltransferase [Longimicrobiaceae bacterium]